MIDAPATFNRVMSWMSYKYQIQVSKDAKLAPKLGQLQPSYCCIPQECMGKLASIFSANVTPFSLQGELYWGSNFADGVYRHSRGL
jgi:hypothetical protein